MVKYRNPNDSCLTCGTQIPSRVTRQTENDYVEYRCADCNDIIIRGIVGTDGETARTPHEPPPAAGYSVSIRQDIDWSVWERWWTRLFSVTMLHGRPVNGNEQLADFLEKVEFVYDNYS